MMNIVVICLGGINDCFVASSVNKGLKRLHPESNISWVVDNNDAVDLLSHSKNIKQITCDDPEDSFDLLINLSGSPYILQQISAKAKIGLFSGAGHDRYYDNLYGDQNIDMNLFQIYYRLAGMSWRGEGYDVCYYPKTKTKQSRVGLAIANANLRNFVSEKLNLELSKLWIVPYKKSILKRIDEVNRCKVVVTDDLLTLHIALYLRKFVHFLKAMPFNTKIETFNSGQVYEVPLRYIR